MKTIVLKGELRNELGKKATNTLRNEGKVPCVVYGNNINKIFSIYEHDFKNLVYTPNTYLVYLNLGDEKYLAKLQDIQFHPVNEAIVHADFMIVSPDKPITLSIPVSLTGNAPGVRAGGKINLKIKKLEVKGLIKNMPDTINVNIDKLEIGQNIRVGDIKIDGIELLDTKANSVVSCSVTRASMSSDADKSAESKSE
ncbi:MAG: 50S ribosomal protein L25/general stress protein Ctc [Bacteroidetes bacterium]|nr:50S ribosomal protein L25/general stress protein Ctc [Bacteroidota bacterium]